MLEADLVEAILKKALGGIPRVQSWSWEFGEDQQGDDAIFVTVLMSDSPRGALKWSSLKPIHDELTRELRRKDAARWPYVRFSLASEVAAANAE